MSVIERIAGRSTNEREPRDPKYKDSIITIPNLICFGRIGGSFVLLALAMFDWRYSFVGLLLVLSLSDFIDGMLARRLHQRSNFGARLDSAADAILYSALIVGAAILSWETVRPELLWMLMAVCSYVLTTGAGLWKYGRVPSYHTFGAKKSQWLVLLAGICLIFDWTVWPLRLASVAVTLTNLEATAITYVLDEWRADVLTIFHVWRPGKPNRVEE